jgi:hypothetical protein
VPSTGPRLVFGIYPGGAAGGDTGLLSGPPDDPIRVIECLNELQGISRPFIVRCYDSFQDLDSPFQSTPCAPPNYIQYAVSGIRPLELVLQFRSSSGDVPGYLDFVQTKLKAYHRDLYSVQITEEANFVDGPNVIDGPYPNVRRALIEGVIVAKQTLSALGASHVKVGFNSTPTFGPAVEFWSNLKDLGSERFSDCLDYVGLDFFPGVFRPVAPTGKPGDLTSSAVAVLGTLRRVWMPAAGITEHVPIHITENGWPTGKDRPEERQAETLEAMIRTVHGLSVELNIERYTLFDLRDVDHTSAAGGDNLFHFFGITAADYRPKQAFGTFRRLVQELGTR